MSEWIKVVTDPLGLAGFALFLVFGLLARVKKSSERRWLAPVAVSAAILALAGGLTLGYLKTSKPLAPAVTNKALAPQQTNQVQQSSSGAGSPNVQGVQGDVVVNVDQSTSGASQKKTPEGTPEQKK